MRYHKEDFKAATKYLYSYKSSKPIGKSYITQKYRIVRYIPEGVYMIEETSSLKIEPHYYKDDSGYGDGWFGYISYTSARYLILDNAKEALDKYVSKHPDNAVGKWSTLQPKTPAKKTGKPSVKVARKLLAEGKLPEGHIRRLGIRRQTPPKAKSRRGDLARDAMLAGYRVSKNGKIYYEARANRSDTPVERRDYAYMATHKKGTRIVKKKLKGLQDKYKPKFYFIIKPNTGIKIRAGELVYLDEKKVKTDKEITEDEQWRIAKRVMRKYKNSKNEVGFCVDKYGNVLYQSVGDGTSVRGPPKSWYDRRRDLRLIDIHSHPLYAEEEQYNWHGNTSTFSYDDFECYNIRGVRDAAVFGGDGRIFRIKWTDPKSLFPTSDMRKYWESTREGGEAAYDDPDVRASLDKIREASEKGESKSTMRKLKEAHAHIFLKRVIDITVEKYIKVSKEDGRFIFTEEKL